MMNQKYENAVYIQVNYPCTQYLYYLYLYCHDEQILTATK